MNEKIKVLINREGLDKYLLAHNMTLLDLANAIFILIVRTCID